MKRALSVLLCLILVIGCFPLTALADDTKLDDGGETGINLTTTVPGLSSITVTPPTKTEYSTGDSLDTAGMVVTAKYTDNTTRDVTQAATLSGFDSSAAGQVTVTVSYTEKDVTKTATFNVMILEPAATTYMISVSADPSEGGTVNGGGEYAENASVTVVATANSGYSFVKWTESGEQVSTDESYTFTATADRTLVAVFEEDAGIYTVTVEPGDGTGESFTVQNTTILSISDVNAGNYDQAKGCFYRENDGEVYYRFPDSCSFTAPTGKEFDCWEITVGTLAGHTFKNGILKIVDMGNFTITALWKEQEAQPSVTLSIPAAIDVKYGDTQTTFDIQVKSTAFTRGKTVLLFRLYDSSFSCSSHNGTIPFTVNSNGNGAINFYGGGGTGSAFEIDQNTELPYTCQSFINITGDAWAAAKPGNYTATLRVKVSWR